MSTSPPPRGPPIENRRTMKLRVESLPTNIRRLRRDVRLDSWIILDCYFRSGVFLLQKNTICIIILA